MLLVPDLFESILVEGPRVTEPTGGTSVTTVLSVSTEERLFR